MTKNQTRKSCCSLGIYPAASTRQTKSRKTRKNTRLFFGFWGLKQAPSVYTHLHQTWNTSNKKTIFPSLPRRYAKTGMKQTKPSKNKRLLRVPSIKRTSLGYLVKPHLFDCRIFWRPGNLNLARRRASTAVGLWLSLDRMEMMIWNNVK